MSASRQTELLNSIGQRLRTILPAGAESITAAGESDDDWADVAFHFTDKTGTIAHFGLDDNPTEASDEIAERLMELHALMATTGQGAWNHFTITVNTSGNLDVAFTQPES